MLFNFQMKTVSSVPEEPIIPKNLPLFVIVGFENFNSVNSFSIGLLNVIVSIDKSLYGNINSFFLLISILKS